MTPAPLPELSGPDPAERAERTERADRAGRSARAAAGIAAAVVIAAVVIAVTALAQASVAAPHLFPSGPSSRGLGALLLLLRQGGLLAAAVAGWVGVIGAGAGSRQGRAAAGVALLLLGAEALRAVLSAIIR
jgi:hypothetical protein